LLIWVGQSDQRQLDARAAGFAVLPPLLVQAAIPPTDRGIN
jgi:hypothetical protein